MNIFRINGKFRVETRGGYCNNNRVPSDTLQLGRYAPVSVMQWREYTDGRDGRGTSVYAMFRAALDDEDARRIREFIADSPRDAKLVRVYPVTRNDGRGPQYEIEFLVCGYSWSPAAPYNWDEYREELVPLRNSPVLGESYEIDIRSMEIRAIPHPMEVAAA